MAFAGEQARGGRVAGEQRVFLAQLHGQDGGYPQGEGFRVRWHLAVSVDNLRLFCCCGGRRGGGHDGVGGRGSEGIGEVRLFTWKAETNTAGLHACDLLQFG